MQYIRTARKDSHRYEDPKLGCFRLVSKTQSASTVNSLGQNAHNRGRRTETEHIQHQRT